MTVSMNFQSIIISLQEFWSQQGCLIWQPYYTQVGAGTMNPATALRVLGPEPWKVAYVEPSIRPDDGRYGENPNRMQMHYQFQVILKPDPGNPQEIYLKSLEALGIDQRQHDIRFVEDNWESPALAAWGLGWEVWLDGQEITQFTYFQQSGGQVLDPVSVEITYGLERIAIALQRVNSFREIQWSPSLTDGDVNLQAEQEHSKYYFEIADIARLRQMFDLFEAEAETCLAQGLVLPAHDFILKCSHTFNILDTRGAISVTDRQAFFARMRNLSRRVAEAYINQRQTLEFPWLDQLSQTQVEVSSPVFPIPSLAQVDHADLLLEIGVEELPVGDVDLAINQLKSQLLNTLDNLHLDYAQVQAHATPRRLVLCLEKLSSRQPDLQQVIKGPPTQRAFKPDGSPTPAAEGFARSKGVPVDQLQTQELDGGEYVVAVVSQPGRSTAALLPEVLPGLLASIRFDKSMRWNSSNVPFSRPIRWLLALYANQTIPFEFAGVASGNTTRGLRFNQPVEIVVKSQEDYFSYLANQGIILNIDDRKKLIQEQMGVLASEVHGRILPDAGLLDEVANLVEAPTALRGDFDPAHLQLPPEVLVSVMKKHQRYFPVYSSEETLLPYFISIANKSTTRTGECLGDDTIRAGNEHVLRARFTDAAYFVREDQKFPLQSYLDRLNTLTFQVKLGSMLDKTNRIVKLVPLLASHLQLDEQQLAVALRSALLCKADLATSMVIEMTSLQGIMGRYYALNSGETAEVATAIFEHYLPRFSGDAIPKSLPGLLVGLADRLDTLAGLFTAGLAPTGSKDPFAQRRAALGLVQNLIAWDLDLDVLVALQESSTLLPIAATSEHLSACLTFIVERLRNLLLERGESYDIVDAVLEAQGRYPSRAVHAVKALSTWVSRPDWNTILPAYARCVRITRDLKLTYPLNPDGFVEPATTTLYEALLAAEQTPAQPGSVDDFLNTFLPLIPAIDQFFDKVLVMTEEDTLRENRLALLQRIATLAQGVADFSRLEGF